MSCIQLRGIHRDCLKLGPMFSINVHVYDLSSVASCTSLRFACLKSVNPGSKATDEVLVVEGAEELLLIPAGLKDFRR